MSLTIPLCYFPILTTTMLAPWKKSYDKPRQHIKKQRHYFAGKVPCSQSYGFSSRQVQMWELDHKESWTLKNWCFWIVVLEKTLESPLDSKEIKPVNPKGDQSWIFIGRTDAEVPVLWPPDAKRQPFGKDPDARKDWGPEEKWVTEDEMVGWLHWLNGHKFEQTPGDSEGLGSLACCSPWSQRVRHDLATAQQPAAPTTNSPKIPNHQIERQRPWRWEGLGQEEKGTTEDEMVGWYHWLDGHEFG